MRTGSSGAGAPAWAFLSLTHLRSRQHASPLDALADMWWMSRVSGSLSRRYRIDTYEPLPSAVAAGTTKTCSGAVSRPAELPTAIQPVAAPYI